MNWKSIWSSWRKLADDDLQPAIYVITSHEAHKLSLPSFVVHHQRDFLSTLFARLFNSTYWISTASSRDWLGKSSADINTQHHSNFLFLPASVFLRLWASYSCLTFLLRRMACVHYGNDWNLFNSFVIKLAPNLWCLTTMRSLPRNFPGFNYSLLSRTVKVIPLLLSHLRHIFSLISKNIFRAILDQTKLNVVYGTLKSLIKSI